MKKKELQQWVCTNCGSNNVQQKMWVNINDNSPDLNSEFNDSEDFYCNDCEEHHNVELKLLKCVNGKPRIQGYQVVSDNGLDLHPEIETSFCLYSLSQANEILLNNDNNCWKLLTLYKGDVENPTLMFKGDPRQ